MVTRVPSPGRDWMSNSSIRRRVPMSPTPRPEAERKLPRRIERSCGSSMPGPSSRAVIWRPVPEAPRSASASEMAPERAYS
jgi:hypothetical protein